MSVTQKAFVGAAVLAAALAGFTPAQSATVPILNSSFEAGTTGRLTGFRNGLRFDQLNTTGAGWDTFTGLQGWTTVSGRRIEVHSDRDPGSLDAQNGDHFISLDGGRNSTIQQSVSLAAGRYMLSFWYSPETANVATNAIGYSLGSLVSGQVSRGTNGAAVGAWTQIQTLFTVTTGGSYALSFGALGTANRTGGFLDNITIAAIPVPAAGYGLLSALIGLGGMRRRRRN